MVLCKLFKSHTLEILETEPNGPSGRINPSSASESGPYDASYVVSRYVTNSSTVAGSYVQKP